MEEKVKKMPVVRPLPLRIYSRLEKHDKTWQQWQETAKTFTINLAQDCKMHGLVRGEKVTVFEHPSDHYYYCLVGSATETQIKIINKKLCRLKK